MNIVALIPTLLRPDGLTRVLKSLRDTAPNVEVVVSSDIDDGTARRIAQEFGAMSAVCKDKRRGPAYAWNEALKVKPDADLYVLGSDDSVFQPGWLEAGLEKLESLGGSGLVGLKSKELGSDSLSAFYMMTRDFIIKHHGGVAAVPHYTSWYLDAEACGRAQLAGCYAKTDAVVVFHDWRGPNGDETYRLAHARRKENEDVYRKRRKLNFPDDFPPILKG